MAARSATDAAMEVELEGRRVRLTNLERAVYPQSGTTKAEVVDYYVRVAPAILPHLRDRPLTLRRFPEGVGGPNRFQKSCMDPRPPWVDTARIPDRHGEHLELCLIQDLPSLVWSANINNLELHPMLARTADVLCPTAVAFDLDPGPPAGLMEAVEVALLLRELLDGVGLNSYAKTSGAKGLQVLVPVNAPVTYAQTKAFARTVARVLAERMPDRVTANVARRERAGRVLVDWGQNDRHKSIVCAYSLRGRPEPTVSTPVTWEELGAACDAADLTFGPTEVLARVERLGDLFACVLDECQVLPDA